MTVRDRLVIVAVLVAAAIAGFWFVGLAPKRKEATDLQAQIATERQQLVEAQQKAAAARQAKARYRTDYADVAMLGKAVPKSDALPSLIYQLQTAAHDARIDFRSLKISGGAGAAPTPTPAPAAAAAASSSSSSSSSSPSSSSGSSSPSSSSSSSSTTTPTPSAPATQTATATLPPGASVGSAGFPTMPFTFVFNGSYFDMERFMREVERFVRVNGDKVDVNGRLLAIDGFSLTAGPTGFPSVKATMAATAYLASPNDATSSSTSTASTPAASAAPAASSNGGTASEVG
jgi:Tfp pilus assembly protein PilO